MQFMAVKGYFCPFCRYAYMTAPCRASVFCPLRHFRSGRPAFNILDLNKVFFRDSSKVISFFMSNNSTHKHISCSENGKKALSLSRKILCAVLSLLMVFSMTGCSRGYISSYSDNAGRSSFSLTAVSADFSGKARLFAQDMCVPGEGISLSIGKNNASALFDLDGGMTVVENNITEKIYPASTTKIMTALLAIKYGKMDTMLKASSTVAGLEWEAQRIGIEPGDKMTLDQALHYLMVYSANDAAIMIAEHIGGTYEKFIDMMNEEAAYLGATSTHFVNPHGLHKDDHYTTAYDLFLIFQECLKYDKFRELIRLDSYSTVFHDKDGNMRAIEVPSTDNYLVGVTKAPNTIRVIGGKTGTTDQAGSCLIILSESSSGKEFVSVVLGAPDSPSLYVSMNQLLRKEREYSKEAK